MRLTTATAALLGLLSQTMPAAAHVGEGMASGFGAGFTHPLFGPDHLLAMVSVGIWGAQLGAPSIWILPIAFPLVMALGAAMGIVGVPLPATELLIAISVVVLGAMVAGAVRVPLAAAFAVVAFFAIAHGYAHGVELPESANALAYSVGFVIATGLLHAVGIAIGLLVQSPKGATAVRAVGASVLLVGVWFIVQYATA